MHLSDAFRETGQYGRESVSPIVRSEGRGSDSWSHSGELPNRSKGQALGDAFASEGNPTGPRIGWRPACAGWPARSVYRWLRATVVPRTVVGMAITRRTAIFAQLAESVESCLDIEGLTAERAEVDRVVNIAIDERSREMGVEPRSLLPYLKSPETALRMAQSIATWFATGTPDDEEARRYAGMARAVDQWVEEQGRPNT